MAPSATLSMWEIYPISTPHVRLRVHGNTPNKDSLGGGQLGGVCFGLDSERGWIANAWEIFAARPRPRLCEIRKFSSISRFEHEAQKKVTSLPRPRPRFRPRFSDLSFHSQPWTKLTVHFFWLFDYRFRYFSSAIVLHAICTCSNAIVLEKNGTDTHPSYLLVHILKENVGSFAEQLMKRLTVIVPLVSMIFLFYG